MWDWVDSLIEAFSEAGDAGAENMFAFEPSADAPWMNVESVSGGAPPLPESSGPGPSYNFGDELARGWENSAATSANQNAARASQNGGLQWLSDAGENLWAKAQANPVGAGLTGYALLGALQSMASGKRGQTPPPATSTQTYSWLPARNYEPMRRKMTNVSAADYAKPGQHLYFEDVMPAFVEKKARGGLIGYAGGGRTQVYPESVYGSGRASSYALGPGAYFFEDLLEQDAPSAADAATTMPDSGSGGLSTLGPSYVDNTPGGSDAGDGGASTTVSSNPVASDAAMAMAAENGGVPGIGGVPASTVGQGIGSVVGAVTGLSGLGVMGNTIGTNVGMGIVGENMAQNTDSVEGAQGTNNPASLASQVANDAVAAEASTAVTADSDAAAAAAVAADAAAANSGNAASAAVAADAAAAATGNATGTDGGGGGGGGKAHGGTVVSPDLLKHLEGYRGGGQSDDVPAMLSAGEYVFDADTVAALGDGSNEAGARKLDAMREEIRKQKRSAPVADIPPKARAPLSYLKKKKGRR